MSLSEKVLRLPGVQRPETGDMRVVGAVTDSTTNRQTHRIPSPHDLLRLQSLSAHSKTVT